MIAFAAFITVMAAAPLVDSDVDAGTRFCQSLLKYPDTTEALLALRARSGWRKVSSVKQSMDSAIYFVRTYKKGDTTALVALPTSASNSPQCRFIVPIAPAAATAAMQQVQKIYREIAATYSKDPFVFQSFNGDRVVGRVQDSGMAGKHLIVTVSRKPVN